MFLLRPKILLLSFGKNNMTEKGLWVAIDGIDAVGKTTQVNAVSNSLRGTLNVPVESIAEFSSFPPGRVITEILERQRFYALHPEKKTPLADTVFLLSDMLTQYETVIAPTVALGGIAVSDRGNISFIAYQALRIEDAGVSLNTDSFQWAHSLAQQCLITPDFTILLTIPEEEMVKRIIQRGESPPSDSELNFLARLNKAVQIAAEVSGSEIVEIDGSLPKENVTDNILELINKKISL